LQIVGVSNAANAASAAAEGTSVLMAISAVQ
jgi:hypothetical protein